ncbi:hypothetical protein PLICRDRAFT_222576 [Plicaturopsis crispa FD-325 SS-3]|nr:hypothetical protein PLICRDRAFT_222576 [Plicaturopsis crispa FD-325 SS-3]
MEVPSSLEQLFQKIEAESAKRAAEEASEQEDAESLTSSASTVPPEANPRPAATITARRHRGSISISRFGQVSYGDIASTTDSAPPTPGRISTIASQSAFYQAHMNAGSVDSLASEATGEPADSRVEDENHVTQMQKIGTQRSISRAFSNRLSLSRGKTRSRNNLVATSPSGEAMLVIGVSVEETTVEGENDGTHSEPLSPVISGGLHNQGSQSSVSVGLQAPEGGGWTAKAKTFAQKIRRRSTAAINRPDP